MGNHERLEERDKYNESFLANMMSTSKRGVPAGAAMLSG